LILIVFLCLPVFYQSASAIAEGAFVPVQPANSGFGLVQAIGLVDLADQKLLGDESDGSRAHPIHLIPLFFENEDGGKGEKITLDDDPLLPFSTRWTCGGCHSYGIIGKGWHFNAAEPNVVPGRVGQPWILVDSRTGTQIPISYRLWPGTFKPEQFGLTARQFVRYFGRHMPGGGAGELESQNPDEIMRQLISGRLEINCLSCHNADPTHNQGEYFPQVVRENFRWASAATCGFATVTGSASDMPDTYDPFMPEPPEDPKKLPPGIKYRKNAFDDDSQVFFNIVREVPNYRCYFCHSNFYIDKQDAEKWTSDEDVHLKAGLKCVDCHRNGIDHNIVRGYDQESIRSSNPLAATSSCEGCHLSMGQDKPQRGRLGAPVPTHTGIPPVHFEKLTCTACHSGPWPGGQTGLVKTSRAHRLGTPNVNKSDVLLPHIIAPVFAKQGGIGAPVSDFAESTVVVRLELVKGGKIAPHKLLWPAYWGILDDKKVTPLDFETVRRTVGEVFSGVELPASGDWPALTEENIAKALTKLAKVVESKAVYVTGGNLYSLDDKGVLNEHKEHPAAQPYLWPIAHDVRPAAQSLGAGACEDCHSPEAPFFFGKVCVDSPVQGKGGAFKNMMDMYKVDGPVYVRVNLFFKLMIIGVMTLLILHILGDLYRRGLLWLTKKPPSSARRKASPSGVRD